MLHTLTAHQQAYMQIIEDQAQVEILKPAITRPLTTKQQAFIEYYVVCRNGQEAARMAGYGGTDDVLAAIATENLSKPHIMRALNEMLQHFAMQSAEVLIHLTDIARADFADVMLPSGAIDILEAKRRAKTHMIKKVRERTTTSTDKDGKEVETHEIEVEMYDRIEALRILAKFHGLVYDRLKIEVDWEAQAIANIQQGHLSYSALAAAFDRQQATKLFLAAKVPIPSNGDITEGQYTELDTDEDTAAPAADDSSE